MSAVVCTVNRLRCGALASVAAATMVPVLFPTAAVASGATSIPAMAPGILCAAAMLLLPGLDKGWPCVAGAVALLAVPGAAATITAGISLRQHDADHAGVHSAFVSVPSSSRAFHEAAAGAFAVAEQWVIPVCLSSASLLFAAARAPTAPTSPCSSAGAGAHLRCISLYTVSTVAQQALVAVVFVIPVLWWTLAGPRPHAVSTDDDVYSVVLSPDVKGSPTSVQPDERALRALLMRLTVCFLVLCSWFALKALQVGWAIRWYPAAVCVMAAAFIATLHGDAAGADLARPPFSLTPVDAVSVFGLSVLQVHHLLRLGVITVVVPLLCATVAPSRDALLHVDDEAGSTAGGAVTRVQEAPTLIQVV